MGSKQKILVSVRVRPLSKKEIANNEVSDWECINDTTIVYKNSRQEQSGFPTKYTFERVFRGDSSTIEVYEEGAKDIALLVLKGINSTIFTYGQTSTGKTYTMKGITKYAIADIYDYMQKHEEMAFIIKFSAIEIYNETVRDLLSKDGPPLRVLDDPVKGMKVDKLTEENVQDLNHLKHLISVCESVRRTRETVLNENSSRSHQILKLTIESSAREISVKDKPMKLSASVNFVDLAGSERASLTMSSGPKLKEGHHINCSLLTLATVIRKLSKGKQGHINYRDSKLTRILQSSLGGNARTAIICTLSPARCHVEQSRNTLLFASCAKEVSTNASLNFVTSDKSMVQHLQNQVSRLENELKEKGSQIKQMEKVIREISKQRDLAESRVEDLLLVNENLRSTMSQSADAHGFVENINEGLVEKEEEEEPFDKITTLLDDGGSLSPSISKSRSSTESAFAEAIVQNLQAAEEDGVLSIHSFVKELKEARVRLEEQLDGQDMISLHGKLETELNDLNGVTLEHPEAHSDWPQQFAKFQKAIINLWQSCNVSLVHRTYFFLLFKGDPTDSIYMEVELRRLTFLEKTYSTKNQLPEDDHHSIASSAKALCQERKKLSKLMQKRYTKVDRDKLFQKWGIDLESKKRKIQLINSIWNNAHDLQHISDSAEIVAKLIKFSEQGQGIKGMLGLSFDSPQCKRRSVSLRESIASLI